MRSFFTLVWGILEGLSYWPFDFGVEWFSDRKPRWFVLSLYFLLGCIIGALSIAFLPNFWLQYPSLRIANLIIAPLIAGSIGVISARWFYRDSPKVDPKDHFLPGFCFSLAVACIRFVYIDRAI